MGLAAMMAPETPLWDLLDQIGLPFRAALAQLVASHCTSACVWLPSLALCTLPSKPLVPGLSPFTVQVHPFADPTLPAFYLSAHYRAHSVKTLADRVVDRRTERNFAEVTAAITRLLGPGEDAATFNTLGRSWQFGMARLRVIGFPPRLNPLPNSRHQSDPGSKTEAFVSLEPGWMPPLTVIERGWLQTFTPLVPCDPLELGVQLAPPWRRVPADMSALSTGCGLAGDGAAFAIVIGPYFQLVPRGRILGLSRDLASPARGAGYATLVLHYAPPDLPEKHAHRLQLMSDRFADHALEIEANRLAQALGVACTVQRYLDD
jgi:hypothetical protein